MMKKIKRLLKKYIKRNFLLVLKKQKNKTKLFLSNVNLLLKCYKRLRPTVTCHHEADFCDTWNINARNIMNDENCKPIFPAAYS